MRSLRLELSETIESKDGSILLLAEPTTLWVLSEFPTHPTRCWQKSLPAPSQSLVELVTDRSQATGEHKPKIALGLSHHGQLIIQREYRTTHYEVGTLHRLDRLSPEGQILTHHEEFVSYLSPEDGGTRLELHESESSSEAKSESDSEDAIILRLLTPHGKLIRERRWE